MDTKCLNKEKVFEKVYELCPCCLYEVELEAKFKKQICPKCKKEILPCAMCLPDEVDCSKCPLDKERS
jgi:predicted RNA-binding Zn-ribbon protein involved in translation (DUF1610 family)